MKIGDKVFVYEVELNFTKNLVEQRKNQHTVIGINKYRFCIDDMQFTSIQHLECTADALNFLSK